MTSGNVNNFVSDLVLMAKAMEELPHVQQALTASEAEANRLAASVQAREESILRLKAEIEALQAKVRSTEVERDNAEMRFLELDEKAHKVLGDFEAIAALVNAGKNELAPPKPEPVAEPQAEPTRGLTDAEIASGYTVKEVARPEGGFDVPHYEVQPPQGQSEPLPSATPETGHGSHSLPVTSFEEVPKSDANPPQDTASVSSIESGTDAQSSGVKPIENVSAPTTIESSTPVDDVGYHNEPDVGTDWTAWNVWCERMRARYGAGAWPQRPDNAAPSVA